MRGIVAILLPAGAGSSPRWKQVARRIQRNREKNVGRNWEAQSGSLRFSANFIKFAGNSEPKPDTLAGTRLNRNNINE